jgi:formylglycine-generating enzyme required for sulfatase activity
MSASVRPTFSPEATAAFAEIVARHDRGEAVDFEREFDERSEIANELRALHANWKKLDRLLGGLQGHESAFASLERDLKRSDAPPDERTQRDLERLSTADRARYAVRERLAVGGMGEIWRVFDADLERDLAMKVIRARGADGSKPPDGRLLRRFLFEARLTGRLDHPGIVPVHDIGIDPEGRVYFTMPLVRGESLAEILERTPAGAESSSRARVLEILLKVCDTLAYAHAQGVVHRDLKPANIMVGRFGETYVMDWGLARVLAEIEDASESAPRTSDDTSALATNDGDVLGTPAYMAPEQAKGKRDAIGPRSDIYAVGAILYHVLAGRMPYAEVDAQRGRAVLEAVQTRPPARAEEFAVDAAPELLAIVRKAMSRAPEARYADMASMAADLRAYMEGRVVGAHEAGAWAELKKWFARNRPFALTSIIAVLVIVLGTAIFAYVQAQNAEEIARFSDARRLTELEARAESLWPAIPANVPALEAWLVEADALAARRPEHEKTLASLRARALGPNAPWKFADANEQWQHDNLQELVTRLQRFTDPFPFLGAIASVRKRIADAREIQHRTLVAAGLAWDAAIASIRDPALCPAYRGLVLAPQIGLVPIGRDPSSGLWEWAHLPSGREPARDDAGRLVLDEKSAIVLVLVPGGRFHMGSVAPVPGQPSGPRTDPNADADEMPITEIELAPFFAGKYEVTREQWQRMTGAEPLASAGSTAALAPIASVSWSEVATTLHHLGLDVPTEAQWEYAARAGTTSRWWCGAEPGSLRGVANGGSVLDPRLSGGGPAPTSLLRVDALRANAFGLVDVHGNVAEWTRDVFAAYSTPARALDGLRITTEDGSRAVRGGSFDSTAAQMRSAARERVARDNHDPRIGVRVVRAIDPAAR